MANDDRCKILISSLQDTLLGVETKSYGSSSRRDRSRSRDRVHRRAARRERSSSRYRDRSRERDREDRERYVCHLLYLQFWLGIDSNQTVIEKPGIIFKISIHLISLQALLHH